jgi:polysaccharide export outer membrane protein
MMVLGPAPPIGAQETDEDNQLIRPGDMIRVFIFREPEMSNDYFVDETGSVIFAGAGEYNVLGDTNATLEKRLLADYGRRLRDPNIDVTVLRRIRIIGSVNTPGLHWVDATVTIADVLAMAGGPTSLGDPDQVRIIRDGREVAIDLTVDMLLSGSIIRSGDQIFVPERSWMSRNSNVVATALSASVALVIALFLR